MKGTFSGVPIKRSIMFLGLYWGPLFSGNYHMWLSSLNIHSEATWQADFTAPPKVKSLSYVALRTPTKG